MIDAAPGPDPELAIVVSSDAAVDVLWAFRRALSARWCGPGRIALEMGPFGGRRRIPPGVPVLSGLPGGWRDFKGALGLRPVFHYREDRIRAHIQLCWLALLLLRVIENITGDTWRNVRRELDRMHLVTLATNASQVAQRTATTPGQQTVLQALDLPEPPRFFDFTLPEGR